MTALLSCQNTPNSAKRFVSGTIIDDFDENSAASVGACSGCGCVRGGFVCFRILIFKFSQIKFYFRNYSVT